MDPRVKPEDDDGIGRLLNADAGDLHKPFHLLILGV